MPEYQAWREDITKAVDRLRNQFIFLFTFLVAALVIITLLLTRADGNFADLVQQIREDRYTSCIQRVVDISTYNARLPGPAGYLPQFPVPRCPPKP